jgi:hypothetical protein
LSGQESKEALVEAHGIVHEKYVSISELTTSEGGYTTYLIAPSDKNNNRNDCANCNHGHTKDTQAKYTTRHARNYLNG